MVSVFSVILQDHVIKGLSVFKGRSPSKSITILPSLVAIGTLIVELKWFSFVT